MAQSIKLQEINNALLVFFAHPEVSGLGRLKQGLFGTSEFFIPSHCQQFSNRECPKFISLRRPQINRAALRNLFATRKGIETGLHGAPHPFDFIESSLFLKSPYGLLADYD
jgi:hypothetical protein